MAPMMREPGLSTRGLVPAGAAPREDPPPASRAAVGPRLEQELDVLHARGVGEMLDTGLDILIERFAPCALFAAVCVLPFRIGSEVLPVGMQGGWELAYLVPQLLTAAFVCSLVGGYFLRRRVTAGEAFREGILALPGVTVLALVQLVTMLGLCLFCVVPVVLGNWLFAVMTAVYVLERRRWTTGPGAPPPGLRWINGVASTFGRGVRLVLGWGSFVRFLGWGSVAVLSIYLPLVSSSSVFETPRVRRFLHQAFAMHGDAVELALAAIGAVFIGIGTAYMAVLQTVYYVDQRVRREAFDLDQRLDALERSAGTPGAGA